MQEVGDNPGGLFQLYGSMSPAVQGTENRRKEMIEDGWRDGGMGREVGGDGQFLSSKEGKLGRF